MQRIADDELYQFLYVQWNRITAKVLLNGLYQALKKMNNWKMKYWRNSDDEYFISVAKRRTQFTFTPSKCDSIHYGADISILYTRIDFPDPNWTIISGK